ncbi:MAG: hydroxylamine oxidoreductase, partial [Planctomycetes bacterium]|nr:hydroxylamine oxidoreductase [Planctomycetota bacterium]
MEVTRRAREEGTMAPRISVPDSSKACVDCHTQANKGIVDQWMGSTHARKGVSCVECHQANEKDADAFSHYGAMIATVITPRDCGRCHTPESAEFQKSHHARAGEILASLDNFLAETVEGSRAMFDPHSPTPGKGSAPVNGMASVQVGCQQCHGSKVALKSVKGGMITVD